MVFFRQKKHLIQTMFNIITCDFIGQAKYTTQTMSNKITCDFLRQSNQLKPHHV